MLAVPLRRGTFEGTMMIRKEMIASMQENKTGMWYVIRKGPSGKRYLAPLRDANVKMNKRGTRILNRKARKATKKRAKVSKFKGGKLHVASAPGQAPAVLFGGLIREIKTVKAEKKSGDTFQMSTIAIHSPYANALEYQMNRPFVRPAIAKCTPAIKARMIELIRQKLGGKV
jgi:hypothetical protein